MYTGTSIYYYTCTWPYYSTVYSMSLCIPVLVFTIIRVHGLTIVQFTCMSLCIPVLVFTIIRVHSDTYVNVGTYVNNTINTAQFYTLFNEHSSST